MINSLAYNKLPPERLAREHPERTYAELKALANQRHKRVSCISCICLPFTPLYCCASDKLWPVPDTWEGKMCCRAVKPNLGLQLCTYLARCCRKKDKPRVNNVVDWLKPLESRDYHRLPPQETMR